MSTVLLEVVTPDRVVLSHPVNMVSVLSGGGELGILPRHAPLAATVKPCVVRVKVPEGEDYIAVSGGFLEIRPDKVTILADAAELASDIDIVRAQAARDRASSRLNQKTEDVDFLRAQMALKRAILRLEAAEKGRNAGTGLPKS